MFEKLVEAKIQEAMRNGEFGIRTRRSTIVK